MKKKIFNLAWGTITVQWNDAADGDPTPTEVMVYDTIGKDPWSNGGISGDEFRKAINEAPTDRDLHIHVNSRGGDVHHGMTMLNSLKDWKNKTGKKVITVIDGVAASTASWAFPAASDEVHAYRGSQMFVHDAMAYAAGNAEEMRKTADDLDKTSDQIADMYAEKSGTGKRGWRDKMKDETLMTGEEAEEAGLVDKIIDGKATRNFTPKEIVNMSNRLSAIYNSAPRHGDQKPQHQKTMNKKKLIAMLNTYGVTEWDGKAISEETSDEHLEAALNSVMNRKEAAKAVINAATAAVSTAVAQVTQADTATSADIKALRDQVNQLTEINNTGKRLRIGTMIDQLVIDDKLSEIEKEKALARAIKDETYIDELKARPALNIGGRPLKPIADLVGNSFNEVQGFILENTSGFMRNFIGSRADNNLGEKTCKEISSRAIIAANTIKKHKNMLVEMFNANTIDAGLQRQIILQEMLEEFAVVLLPLTNFSTVFNNVPLEGTDEVDVPFYPLATDAGNSWDPTQGYAANLLGGTVTNTRPVVVGGNGVTSGANAPAGTARDRKWIGAQFSSYELARQPYLNVQKLMIQKANRLGVLIFTDIISRVICAANFGASVKAVPAAQFSGDDVADLWEQATGRDWPQRGRALVLDHRYRTPLIKDPTFKQYLSYGATDPLRKAVIQEAYGFEDMPIVPNLAGYSPANENLVGWINWLYAVLIATAPVMPTPDVRALMTRYDVVVNPATGIAFEYRRFGDATLDQTKEVVECTYGANKGVASALARITSQ
jgi:ATP-dependent protease ClpP protease subunit